MKALVLSGGGSRGAFQAGVIQGLFEQGFRPDLICGVSIGAFNGFFAAQHRISELIGLWKKIQNSDDVYQKRWFAAPLMYFGYQWGYPSLYKPGQMSSLLKTEVKKLSQSQFKSKLRISAVDLVSGQHRSVGQDHPLLEKFIGASMAVPLAFPPIRIKDKNIGGIYVDGCIRNITPLAEAIKNGADEIHIVLTSGSQLKEQKVSFKQYDHILSRTVDIALHEILLQDIKNTLVRNQLADLDPESKFRHVDLFVYEPKNSMTLPNLLDFEPKGIADAISKGNECSKIPITSRSLAGRL